MSGRPSPTSRLGHGESGDFSPFSEILFWAVIALYVGVVIFLVIR